MAEEPQQTRYYKFPDALTLPVVQTYNIYPNGGEKSILPPSLQKVYENLEQGNTFSITFDMTKAAKKLPSEGGEVTINGQTSINFKAPKLEKGTLMRTLPDGDTSFINVKDINSYSGNTDQGLVEIVAEIFGEKDLVVKGIWLWGNGAENGLNIFGQPPPPKGDSLQWNLAVWIFTKDSKVGLIVGNLPAKSTHEQAIDNFMKKKSADKEDQKDDQ